MNLRGIANAYTQTINPNQSVVVLSSDGYTVDPLTRRQVPAYVSTPGEANIQALSADDVKQMDGLNIQGTLRAAYLYGQVAGVIKPDERGGDMLVFDGGVWLVVKVLEQWPDWCKVVICYQGAES
jgi:hypothetical protein